MTGPWHERVIVIGPTLREAILEAGWYPNVVAMASRRSLDRLRGVSAERVVYVNNRVERSDAEAIAQAIAPCLVMVKCGHEALSGLEGPVEELGRWPEVWACDGCGKITIDATAGARL